MSETDTTEPDETPSIMSTEGVTRLEHYPPHAPHPIVENPPEVSTNTDEERFPPGWTLAGTTTATMADTLQTVSVADTLTAISREEWPITAEEIAAQEVTLTEGNERTPVAPQLVVAYGLTGYADPDMPPERAAAMLGELANTIRDIERGDLPLATPEEIAAEAAALVTPVGDITAEEATGLPDPWEALAQREEELHVLARQNGCQHKDRHGHSTVQELTGVEPVGGHTLHVRHCWRCGEYQPLGRAVDKFSGHKTEILAATIAAAYAAKPGVAYERYIHTNHALKLGWNAGPSNTAAVNAEREAGALAKTIIHVSDDVWEGH
jgi:hypothetical protein